MKPPRTPYSVKLDDNGNLHECYASQELDWEDHISDEDAGDSNSPAIRLLRVRMRVTELGRALARGQATMFDGTNVRDEINHLYRAMTGNNEDTLARKELIGAIMFAAAHIKADTTDEDLYGMVCSDPSISDEVAERLWPHVAKVALAVRLARRGRGRPKRDEPSGSKWAAFAEVVRLAGLVIVDEKTLEQMMKAGDGIDVTPLDWEPENP